MVPYSSIGWLRLAQIVLVANTHAFDISVTGRSAFLHHTSSSTLHVNNPSFEYEYIPTTPSDDANTSSIQSWNSPLESAYDTQLPASLRGEAVRSALCSGQCLALQANSLKPWRLRGKGALDFLKQKFTSGFSSFDSSKKTSDTVTTCWLSPKGRVVDQLRVAKLSTNDCMILDGHGMEKLEQLIFPMDQVTLSQLSHAFSFVLISTQASHLQRSWQDITSFLGMDPTPLLDSNHRPLTISLSNDDNNGILVAPMESFPTCGGVAVSFLFWGEIASRQGKEVWEHLISDRNIQGPVRIGPLEYETLRIELGMPAYGTEFTASGDGEPTPASPLELHLNDQIDTEKGCYMGQEGVASIMKNPRGPPRLLYQVIFEDDFNLYEHQSLGDKDINLTKIPAVGDKLFVLGSNEEIHVATITSVAEPGGTGRAMTAALALARRPDSVLSKMRDMDLSMPSFSSVTRADDGSGMIMPPPLDPLHGLEIIVGGTYTVGRLAMVPSRRYSSKTNIFMDEVDLNDFGEVTMEPIRASDVMTPNAEFDMPRWEDADVEEGARTEGDIANEESELVDEEVERKVAKMEMLRKRAEEATARRKMQQQEFKNGAVGKISTSVDEEEAKRKEEKLEILRKRAEEAMARRKNKQNGNTQADD